MNLFKESQRPAEGPLRISGLNLKASKLGDVKDYTQP